MQAKELTAKELRIGNWVQAPLGEIMRVTELGHIENPEYIKAKYENGFGQNWFEGIPLTPEILEKCGFKDGQLNGFTVGYNGDDFIKEQMSVAYLGNIISSVKYLHQLQNLFFCLTGEELEVNLVVLLWLIG